jgi:hypothetical protein
MGYSLHKVRVVFFKKTTKKIFTLSPLYKEFRQVWNFCQADIPKTKDLRIGLFVQVYLPNRLLGRSKVFILPQDEQHS